MSASSHILHVLLNDQIVLEFDRSKSLPDIQLEYLDNMDKRLDTSIQLNKKNTTAKTQLEKAQFIANNMVNSLLNQDDKQAIAMCTYLGHRLPDLKQIACVGNAEEGIKIEFIYDRNLQEKQQEHTLQFMDPKNFHKTISN